MAEVNRPKAAFRRLPKVWSSFATSEFLRIAVEAYQTVEKNKKEIYKRIAAALNESLTTSRAEIPVSADQVTAKYDAYKKKWTVWRNLNGKKGAGWDPKYGTVSGSESWWGDRVTEYGPMVLKYMTSPVKNLIEPEQIFGNSVATGSGDYTPGSTSQNVQPEPRSPPPGFEQPTFFFEEPQVPLEDIQTQQSFPEPPNPQRGVGSSSRHRSGRRGRTETSSKVEEIVDMIHSRQLSKKSRSDPDSLNSHPDTNASNSSSSNASPLCTEIPKVEQTIDRARTFDGIDMPHAILILTSKGNQDTFMILPDDEATSWLRFEIEVRKQALRYR